MMLVWWLNGLMKVNEMQVPIRASRITGFIPTSSATVIATGVRMDAAAALDITLVKITVINPKTRMTSTSLPDTR